MTNKRIKEKQAEIPEELLPGYEWETSGGKAKRIKEVKPIKKEYIKNLYLNVLSL